MNEALNNIPAGFLSFNDTGHILQINNTLLNLLGYSSEEVADKKFESLLNIPGRIFFQTHFFPILKLHYKADEIFLSLLHRNGDLIPVVTNSNRVEINGSAVNQCVFIPVFNRRAFEDDMLAARKTAEKALKENSELIKSRSEVEKHALELDEQLTRLSQVNNELLQYNEIINHDMQECIRKILLYSKLTLEENDLLNIEKVIQSAKRLKSINATLELFIELGLNREIPVKIDLNKILTRLCSEVQIKFREHEIKTSIQDIPVVIGSAWQLKLLFEHIIENAIMHGGKPSVNINISKVTYEENKFRNLSEKYHYLEVVRIIVSDDGKGIEKDELPTIFELLKKKDNKENTLGSGLAICKKVVENHHGTISIEAKKGGGTTVTVVLPL